MQRHHEDQRPSWLASLASQNAAYFAAVGFVILQVSIGIVMKASQNEKGQYGFSTSGCVTISEFCKLLLSMGLFWIEVRRRRSSGAEHVALPTSERSSLELHDLLSEDEGMEEKTVMGEGKEVGICRLWMLEIGVEKRFGFAILGLLYALINNTIFVAYKLADPGTISLTRSGVTFITALVMICALGTTITKIQWMAIVLQVFGLIVSQYHAKTGTYYPLSTYLILLFQVFLSALSGVYNQALLKKGNASLHASNMMLYSSGVIFNLIIHLTTRLLSPLEPTFFTGYDRVGAVLVVVSNVFMGIAISAVFKYADAVVKCLATAVSTGILLYISPILFSIPMNPLIIPGAAVVLISSWLYMETAVRNEQHEEINTGPSYRQSLVDAFSEWTDEHRRIILSVGAVLTITIASFLGSAKASMPDLRQQESSTGLLGSATLLESPFKKTLAFVRSNNSDPESIQLLEQYAPFFHTLHLSMPDHPQNTSFLSNLTHDSWNDGSLVYKQVAQTMQLILSAPSKSPMSEIESLLFFTGNTWIDPLDFSSSELRALFMRSLTCSTTNTNNPNRGQEAALQAVETLSLTDFPYNVNPKEWCAGRSDVYHVPRRFWVDFIFLAKVFYASETTADTAVATMMHIIDQSRRELPFRSILSSLGDCHTSSTATVDIQTIINHRCGGPIDFTNPVVRQALEKRSEEQKLWLGKQVVEVVRQNWTAEAKGGDVGAYYEGIGWSVTSTEEEVEELLEAMRNLKRGDENSTAVQK